MDNLTCAILKMKSDKRVVYIRRPEAAESDYIVADRGQNSSHLASKFTDLILQQVEFQPKTPISGDCT